MKKRFLILLFAVLVCLTSVVSVSANEDNPRLFDGADILTTSEEMALSNRLDQVSEFYQVDIYIMSVETTGMYMTDEYAEYVYDSNNFGFGTYRDGILLLLTMQEREYYILANGLGADALSDDDIDYIGDAIVSDLSNGYYADAFDTFIDECEYQIDGAINGFELPFETEFEISGISLPLYAIPTSLIIGLIIALIVTGTMKAQLKSVRMQESARDYTKPGSMHVSIASDLYLYRTVTRTQRESSSSRSSRSGGSSRRGGGGRF